MDEAAILVSIEAHFCIDSELLQESATKSRTKRAREPSRLFTDNA